MPSRLSGLAKGVEWPPLGVVVDEITLKLDRRAIFVGVDGYPYWDTEQDSDIPKRFRILQAEGELVLQSAGIDHLSEKQRRQSYGLIAEAWALGMQDDHERALRMIHEAGRLTARRLTTSARRWLIYVALAGLLLAAGLLWVAWVLFRIPHDTAYSAVLLGVIGAAFSLLSRYNRLAVDAGAGRAAHYWETAARLVVGGTAGFMAQLAIHADFALSALRANEWGILFAFMVAGSSERLMPSLLRAAEETTNAKRQGAAPDFLDCKPAPTKPAEDECSEQEEGSDQKSKETSAVEPKAPDAKPPSA